MTLPRTLHILVAPLDWGLGHTSRCVPIIRQLLERGCHVIAAGTDAQQSFYEQTFRQEVTSGAMTLRTLAGYNVRYAATARGFLPRIFQQFPGLIRTIRAEHRWLSALIEEDRIDGILSDNRYGLYNAHVPSVVLTHQLSPRTGMGKGADDFVRRIHYRELQKFRECWVVDTMQSPGMSGALSHPQVLPRHARHIGLLSQFSDGVQLLEGGRDRPLLILLSGPEPQRTILSQKLWAQVQNYNGQVVFVEGREDAAVPDKIPPHVTHHRRLTAVALKPLLEEASTIVCRSGYSTLMDLVLLGKRAVIIPTPGQTEQEYLAKMLAVGGPFVAARQENFSLSSALAELNSAPQKNQGISADDFQTFRPVLDDWLNTL